MLNGATQICITKLDVLFPDCASKNSFDDLSKDAKAFIKNIEAELHTPVTIIGTGPDTIDVIDRRN
jgi:adenylosuccinate synthase